MVKCKRFGALLSLLLCGSMMLSACGGGGASFPSATDPTPAPADSSVTDAPADTEPAPAASGDAIDVSLGYFSTTNPMDEVYWPTDFVVEMERLLGINLEFVTYDQDKLNIALASGELSDLMMVNPTQAKTVLDGGLAVPLDDYLDEYGQNIKKFEVRNEIIRHFMSNGDGKLYFHTPNAGEEEKTGGTQIWNGYIVRWDLYKEIGAPEMKTDDDFINVMKQMQAAYPTTEDGKPVYGIGIFNDWGLWGWNMGQFANRGYQNTTSWAYAASYVTNDLVSNYMDLENGPFWKSMSFYNKLYLEGLLDPDSFTMKEEEVKEKAGAGQYVGGFCTWFLDNLYRNEREKDPDTIKGFMAVPAENQGGWYGGNHVAGWGDKDMFITTSARDVVKCVQILDWFDSPDANRLHYAGIEGKSWEYVDGTPRMKQEILDLRAQGTGTNEWKKLGINSIANFIGSSAFGTHTDGYYYNLFDDVEVKKSTLNGLQKDFSEFYGVNYPSEKHYNMVKEGNAFNQQNVLITAINMGLAEVPSDISRIDSKVDEIATKAIPSLVQAQTAEEFQAAQDKFLSDIKEAGAEEAWNWWKPQWDAAKNYVESVVK